MYVCLALTEHNEQRPWHYWITIDLEFLFCDYGIIFILCILVFIPNRGVLCVLMVITLISFGSYFEHLPTVFFPCKCVALVLSWYSWVVIYHTSILLFLLFLFDHMSVISSSFSAMAPLEGVPCQLVRIMECKQGAVRAVRFNGKDSGSACDILILCSKSKAFIILTNILNGNTFQCLRNTFIWYINYIYVWVHVYV